MVVHGAQLFLAPVANLTLRVSDIFQRIVNTNVYITRGGSGSESMAPHNDLQCTLIVQVQGRKTWRLWDVPQVALARSARETLGKQPDRELDPRKLGTPVLEVTLAPGEILYVPRGMVHATSTAELSEEETSMHLTVGLEAGFGWTLEGVLGTASGMMRAESRDESRFFSVFAQAITKAANRDPDFRRTIPPSAFAECALSETGQCPTDVLGGSGAWSGLVSRALHSAVDEMMAGDGFGQFVHAATAEMRGELGLWRQAIRGLHTGVDACGIG